MLNQSRTNCDTANIINNRNSSSTTSLSKATTETRINFNNISNSNEGEYFNYQNYILQQKELLAKIHQQQKKFKKFSQRHNKEKSLLDSSINSRLSSQQPDMSFNINNNNNNNNNNLNTSNRKNNNNNNNNSHLDCDIKRAYSTNLTLNSMHLENLKNSSNLLKPNSPNFSKKKCLIISQFVFFFSLIFCF